MTAAGFPSRTRPVILVADDSPDDRVLAREAFEAAGLPHTMHLVDDGLEALRFLNREGEYREAARPDLILLDLNMPRLNGFETIRAIKQDPGLRQIPTVVLTVSDREEDVVRAYQDGAATYIRKPALFDDFVRLVTDFHRYWVEVARLPHES